VEVAVVLFQIPFKVSLNNLSFQLAPFKWPPMAAFLRLLSVVVEI